MNFSFSRLILPLGSAAASLVPHMAFAYGNCFKIPRAPIFNLSTTCTDGATDSRVAVTFSQDCSYNPSGTVKHPGGRFATKLVRGGVNVYVNFYGDIPELVGSEVVDGVQQSSVTFVGLADAPFNQETPPFYRSASAPRLKPSIVWQKDFATAETPWSLESVHLAIAQSHPQGFDFSRFPETTTIELVDCAAR